MERSETKSPTEEIKLKFVGRIMLMAFGCMAACALIAIMPLLALMSSGQPSAPILMPNGEDVAADNRAADEYMQLRSVESVNEDTSSLGGFAVLIPVAIVLSVIFLIGYGVYDMFRLYLQYRRAKDLDEAMFP
jgi:hypothetical protein